MRLLIITRKIDKDDSQAGFVYDWVRKFGEKTDSLKVICLSKGNVNGLPENIEIFSMGKEKGKNRLREFIRFQIGALKFIYQIDGVFCHMNPIYTILIAPYAKIFRKKIITWYSHKEINWQVRLINILADKIITPTLESFGIKSKKKTIVGHGININSFKPDIAKRDRSVFRIISVGRISPIKDYQTLIKAVKILIDKYSINNIEVNIVGTPGLQKQQEYFEKTKALVKTNGLSSYITFLGAVSNFNLPCYYQRSDLSVNLCPTGSPDKAVLESMACGLPAFVCNKTFEKDLGHYGNQLLFEEKNSEDLAEKVFNLIRRDNFKEIGEFLRKQVVQHHNLDNLVDRIIQCF